MAGCSQNIANVYIGIRTPEPGYFSCQKKEKGEPSQRDEQKEKNDCRDVMIANGEYDIISTLLCDENDDRCGVYIWSSSNKPSSKSKIKDNIQSFMYRIIFS